jgi:hypothetical protein
VEINDITGEIIDASINIHKIPGPAKYGKPGD